jgi:hypothetical protein
MANMRLDLDELEAAARRLVLAVSRVNESRRGDKDVALAALHELAESRQAYDRAFGSPQVGLALIVRIREYDAAVGEAAGAFESASNARRRSEYADELRALIAKGTTFL